MFASWASNGAITSAVAFSSDVGMQSNGDDLGGACRISRATSAASVQRRVSMYTKLDLGG